MRGRVATLVGLVAALAVVLVPSGGAAGNAPALTELFQVSGSLKCVGSVDPNVSCPQIPGTPGTGKQLGGAEFHLWLYRSLDGTRTWGNSNVRFEVVTPGEQGFLDDPPTGPHPGATTQTNTYTSWFIAPSMILPCLPGAVGCSFVPARNAWFRNIFWVNGTACLAGNFVEEDPLHPLNDPRFVRCDPLVNQPTNHPSLPGKYDWDNLLAWIAGPAPPGVSANINVTQSYVMTVAP
jgi:hypothetical protein